MEYLLESTCYLLIREINNVSTVKCFLTLAHNQARGIITWLCSVFVLFLRKWYTLLIKIWSVAAVFSFI